MAKKTAAESEEAKLKKKLSTKKADDSAAAVRSLRKLAWPMMAAVMAVLIGLQRRQHPTSQYCRRSNSNSNALHVVPPVTGYRLKTCDS